jgi:hypothetical protein
MSLNIAPILVSRGKKYQNDNKFFILLKMFLTFLHQIPCIDQQPDHCDFWFGT